MNTITQQFEAFAEGQKKVYSFWADASKKMMDTFSENDKKEATGEELLKAWYDEQKALFENAMQFGDPKTAFEKTPEHFQKWVDLQTKFTSKWMDFYQSNAIKTPFEMPKSWNGDFKTFNDWMNNSTTWIRDNIMDKLPPNMQPHLKNFTKVYDELGKYWSSFVKMIEFGVYNKEVIDKYFSPNAYQKVVNQFMGFSNTSNVSDLIDKANEMFENILKPFQTNTPTIEFFMDNWTKQTKKMAAGNTSPYFQFAADLNDQIHQNLVPYYNVLGPTKEVQAAKIIRDIQFTYVAYLVRTAEMQTMVYQAGQNALPETLKAFYDEYQETNTLPQYQDFFNHYVNILEKYIIGVLESDEYSKLQNKLAKAGLGVKSKIDELVELSFAELPFVMRSEANDIAQEASALRKKVRSLERKLSNIERQLAEKPTPKKRTTRRKTSTRTTTKNTDKTTPKS